MRIIYQEQQRLDYIFDLVKSYNDSDEIKAILSNHLCVLVSAFIENSFRNMIIQYAKNKSHPNISNYINTQMKYLTNLNEEKMRQLLNSFDRNWSVSFSHAITEKEKAAIDSIINNKNNIAHGRATTLSFAYINDYYISAKKVIKIVQKLFDS
jgi:hypothetical protein